MRFAHPGCISRTTALTLTGIPEKMPMPPLCGGTVAGCGSLGVRDAAGGEFTSLEGCLPA
jgi:hypothetical protein